VLLFIGIGITGMMPYIKHQKKKQDHKGKFKAQPAEKFINYLSTFKASVER
jgi:hypothetical protein